MIYLGQPNKVFDTITQVRTMYIHRQQQQEKEPSSTYYDLWLDFLCRQKYKSKHNLKLDLFELDCIHGRDCWIKTKCNSCTRPEIVNSNEEIRAQENKERRSNLRRNIRRRVGYQELQLEEKIPIPIPIPDTLYKDKQSTTQYQSTKERAFDDFDCFVEVYFR